MNLGAFGAVGREIQKQNPRSWKLRGFCRYPQEKTLSDASTPPIIDVDTGKSKRNAPEIRVHVYKLCSKSSPGVCSARAP